jgi:hypothetical protein
VTWSQLPVSSKNVLHVVADWQMAFGTYTVTRHAIQLLPSTRTCPSPPLTQYLSGQGGGERTVETRVTIRDESVNQCSYRLYLVTD